MTEAMRSEADPRPPCVLLTTGDAWASLLGMVRSLGARGVPLHAVGLGVGLDLLRASRHGCETHSLPYAQDSTRDADRLVAWWRGRREPASPMLVPMSDRACTLVAEARGRIDGTFRVCAAEPTTVLDFLDKRRAHEVARSVGLTVPESVFVSSLEEIDDAARRLPFPVILKPTWWRVEGARPFKTVLCESASRLLHEGGRLLRSGAHLTIQEYVPGGDGDVEVYLFYRSADGSRTYDCTGRKIRQVPAGAGIMASGRTEWLPDVVETSREFLRRIDYRGLGGIEFKRKGSRRYFIEMSVRPEGFHPLAIRSGIDLPWIAYADVALGRPVSAGARQTDAFWLDELPYLGLLLRTRERRELAWEALRLLNRSGPVLGVFSSEDPLPGLFWLAARLRRVVSRRLAGARPPSG